MAKSSSSGIGGRIDYDSQKPRASKLFNRPRVLGATHWIVSAPAHVLEKRNSASAVLMLGAHHSEQTPERMMAQENRDPPRPSSFAISLDRPGICAEYQSRPNCDLRSFSRESKGRVILGLGGPGCRDRPSRVSSYRLRRSAIPFGSNSPQSPPIARAHAQAPNSMNPIKLMRRGSEELYSFVHDSKLTAPP
eukprot:5802760-Amphidinium_carterae.3